MPVEERPLDLETLHFLHAGAGRLLVAWLRTRSSHMPRTLDPSQVYMRWQSERAAIASIHAHISICHRPMTDTAVCKKCSTQRVQ